MPVIKKMSVFVLCVLFLVTMTLFLTSCAPDEEEEERDIATEPQYGGVLKHAWGSEPPSLDAIKHRVSEATLLCAEHINEYLFYLDSSYLPRPGLAESHSMSEDGLVHTIKLREGVLFHNGKEMTAEDAAASFNRYLTAPTSIPPVAQFTESIEAVDRYTVEWRLKEPFADFLYAVSNGTGAVVFPKEIVEKYGDDTIADEDIIGTGPYKLKERAPDRYIHLIRFEDYVDREEEPDLYFGRKYAYLDEIHIEILPDPSVRMMGLEMGQYHISDILYEGYDRVRDNPDINVIVHDSVIYLNATLNTLTGPFSDLRMRQAAQAAVDAEEMAIACFAHPDLYVIDDCGKIMRPIEKWFTEAGCEYYNQADPEKARQMLEEAGYDDEPITVLALADWDYLRLFGVVITEQLRRAGFNAELLAVDSPSLAIWYLDPEKWDVFAYFRIIDPSLGRWTTVSEGVTGWFMPEERKELARRLRTEIEYDKRYKVWEEMQLFMRENAPTIKGPTVRSIRAHSVDVGGRDERRQVAARHWNTWLRQ